MKKILVILTTLIINFSYVNAQNVDYKLVDETLKNAVKEYHIPSMSVEVVSSDSILFSSTYGSCDDLNTPFIIGSTSKSFTALGIMKLVEMGKIDINKSLSTYIDTSLYFKNSKDGEKITIKQLLNHTSGLSVYQNLNNAKVTENYGKFEYSNLNYFLLGKVIESVSGDSYSEYMEENIFIPLQMTNTSATLKQSESNNLISGYQNYFGIPIHIQPNYNDNKLLYKVPAGYISASANDMGKYLQMYLNYGQNIVSHDTIENMFYNNILADKDAKFYYGMGLEYTDKYKIPIIMHNGLVENYISYMFIIPEEDIAIVLLANINDYFVTNNLFGKIAENLMKLHIGEEQVSIPENTYLKYHIIIDVIYLLLLFVAIYPFIKLKKWRNKYNKKLTIVIDVIRHIIFPIILLFGIGIPFEMVWDFVNDLGIIIIITCSLLIILGIYKIYYIISHLNKC